MEGNVFDIKRFALNDGPGIRTTVFLAGCSLHCWWCHNPESIRMQGITMNKTVLVDGVCFSEKQNPSRKFSVGDLMIELDKEATFMQDSGGGVTFSGGEPLLQTDFLVRVMKSCQERSYHQIVDTAGNVSQKSFEQVLPFVDCFYFDLKLINPESHQKYTGSSNELILSNLKWLIRQKASIQIRIPLIPRVNDTKAHLDDMINFLRSKPELDSIHLIPFHHLAQNKYEQLKTENQLKNVKPHSVEELNQILAAFQVLDAEVILVR